MENSVLLFLTDSLALFHPDWLLLSPTPWVYLILLSSNFELEFATCAFSEFALSEFFGFSDVSRDSEPG